MGILSALRRKSAGTGFEEVIRRLDGQAGRRSKSGHTVSHTTALEVSVVLACVDAIASGCATPPLQVFRKRADGENEPALDHPAYRVLNRRPNEWQTSFEFRYMLTAHAALTGNGYAVPTFVKGRLAEMIPVMPHQVTIEERSRYDRVYRIVDEWGEIGVFEPRQVFHLKNFMWDGVRGLDAVRKARDAIGLAMATEDSQSLLHENGGRPGGLLTTDGTLSPEAAARLKAAFDGSLRGKRAFGTAVLDGGLKYQSMSMTGVDAQHIETRKFQIEEICRAFGVFPQLVMHADKTATFASAEAFFSAHSRLTQGKWHENWRQRVDEYVLDGDGPLFVDFDTRMMNAASLKDRGQYYAKALGAGGAPAWMTQNEVRKELGLAPKDGGNDLPKPTNAIMPDDDDDREGDDDKDD